MGAGVQSSVTAQPASAPATPGEPPHSPGTPPRWVLLCWGPSWHCMAPTGDTLCYHNSQIWLMSHDLKMPALSRSDRFCCNNNMHDGSALTVSFHGIKRLHMTVPHLAQLICQTRSEQVCFKLQQESVGDAALQVVAKSHPHRQHTVTTA